MVRRPFLDRHRLLARALVVACLIEIACQSSVRTDAVKESTPPPQTTNVAAPERSDGAVADADGSAPDSATAEGKTWFETGSYKVRLVRIAACEEPSAGSRPPEASLKRWVGLFLEIVSAKNESFTSPRDVTLERAGIVLEPRFHEAPSLTGCMPLMKQKLLRSGDKLRGIVLFQIPPSFEVAKGSITLAYRPTRWGRAPRVEIILPDCLDRCSGNVEESRGAARTKGTKSFRPKTSH